MKVILLQSRFLRKKDILIEMSETLLIRETLNSKDIDRLMAGEKILEPGEVENITRECKKKRALCSQETIEATPTDVEVETTVTTGEAYDKNSLIMEW